MFKYYHILPDEVGRQDPKMLFELIYGLNDEQKANEYDTSDPYLRMFYGM